MDLCKYKYAFGKPGEGFHRHFGFGFAILDLLATVTGAYLLSRGFKLSFVYTLIALLLLGTLLHVIFCVPTSFLKLINYINFYLII